MKVKLGEVADVHISGVDKKTIPGEKPVRLCNYTDVYYNWTIRKGLYQSFMTASARDSEIAKFRLRAGQVALTKDSETRDDIGHPAYIADDFEDVILGYHCALISPHAGMLDGRYLNGLLRTRHISDYLSRNAGGSGQRYYLSDSTIKAMPISLPPIAAQLRIAGVLGSLDEKITLNRKKIAELEALAKTIYDYWFVQFDFPDKNGKPYKSSGGKMVWSDQLKREVPDGWEVITLGALLAKIPSTKRLATDEFRKDGNFPIIDQSDVFIAGYTSESSAVLSLPRCIVFGDHSCTVKMVNFPFCRGADGTQIIVSNCETIISTYQLYFYVKHLSFDGQYKRHFSFLKQHLLPINRTITLGDEFRCRIEPLFNAIRNCRNAITLLVMVRDNLLPLLMNGQVTVGDLK